MKKNNSDGGSLYHSLKKPLLIMRIAIFFLLVGFLQTRATDTYSQNAKLSISFSNTSLDKILDKIENQSEFYFLYNEKLIDVTRKVSIEAKDEKIEEVLKNLFTGTDVEYSINDRKIILAPAYLSESQQIGKRISGKVTNQSGAPIPGTTVVVKGTTLGVATDINGVFSLLLPENAKELVVSFIGMKTQEVPIGNNTTINVTLTEESVDLEEVVAVGYGVQKKATLSGAVSAVKGKEIITTKNENVQNMLAGKIAGVRVTQKTSEPGRFINNFDIRGMGAPLIIIDGIPRSSEDFQRMDPNDIEDLSVLKDASAAIYGVRSANGVVLVTTKRGRVNTAPELTYSGSLTYQVPSGMPATLNALDWMTLVNEGGMHNINGGNIIWPDTEFEAYRTGAKQSTDWYNTIFSKVTPQTQHNITVTGGSQKTTYHIGLGYLYQDGFYKSNDLNYNKYNIRSNITTEVAKGLTFDLNLNAIMDQQNNPYIDALNIIKTFWRTGPHNPPYADPEQTKYFYGLIGGDNPLAWINSDAVGYRKYNNKWMESSASLKWDIPGVKGLSLKALFNYDYHTTDGTLYRHAYNQYRLNAITGLYDSYPQQSPSTITRQAYMRTQLLTQTMLNYDRAFGKHNIKGTLVWETQKRTGDNFSAARELSLPLDHLFAGVPTNQVATMDAGAGSLYANANQALAGKINYAFSNKYLVEAMFRYDGSSKFGPGHQWGFFPGGSVGWRISEEKFFRNSPLSFMQQLKLRASYGILGDDGASTYQFVSGYNYPTSSNLRMFNAGYVFNGNYTASADNKGIPNPNITWYTSKSFDAGVDMDAWNGLFGFTFDYFNRTREGLLTTRSGGIPTVVGAGLPQENINSDRTFGLDLELSHRNKIGDFTYQLKALGSVTRVKRLMVERAPNGSSWNNWRNNQNDRLQGTYWGYKYDGHFTSWDQIQNSPVFIGRSTIIGDYKMQDWNGDGEINGQDVHPIHFDNYPWVNYSFILSGDYKGFDINVLFQGSALSSLTYGEKFLATAFGNDNALASKFDRWHPVDPKADPYDPATQWVPGYYAYPGTAITSNSSFNTENSSYFRLKSIELGYTLSNLKVVKNVRIYVNAYNLFTISKVRDVDPEHPEDEYGYMYPLNRTYSVGINVKF